MDILGQLQQIAVERDLEVEDLKEELEEALTIAYKKNIGATADIEVKLDASDPKKRVRFVVMKEVVGEVIEPDYQIALGVARKTDPNVEVGDFVPREIPMDRFGRIAAQTFKQVLNQKVREAELRRIRDTFDEHMEDVMVGTVTRRDGPNVLLQIDRHEVKLPKREQVGTDDYRPNERILVYVLKAEEAGNRFEVVVSRTHPGLLRRAIEREVPEIHEGLVTIEAVAREPGQRSKIAVSSRDERIDAIGACVGQRGQRIQMLMEEVRPEKIDVVPFSSDPKEYITNALSPAKVNSIRLNEEEKSAYVVVPDSQLSLAIGRGGQNVRLAARLTEWKIDIRSESQAAEEAKAGPKEVAPDEQTASAPESDKGPNTVESGTSSEEKPSD
ncbi:MAG: transcription termination factor NusA [Fimbriimonadaceae bacterium]